MSSNLKELIYQFNEVLLPRVNMYIEYFNAVSKMKKMAEDIKYVTESIENFQTICTLLGYPHHYSLFISQRELDLLFKDFHGNEDEVKQIIDNFYIARFDDMYIKEKFLKRWEQATILSRRLKIIRESISCFEQQLYFTAIPVLFSQLEGMVADGYNHKGRMSSKQLKQYILDLLNAEDSSFKAQLSKFYTNTILVGFEHNEPIDSFLSRHAIMHGADVEYGTKQNYIKLLLFFDLIYERIIEKQRERENL
ncbi:hypothetical protein DW1_1150 [Proteiniborus sp. DW1]|uniref:hypothetical protein n=1 Tax=Proteiniborus sp. DW1 TaxID=1889883 RepID=UPI00092E1A39|nr:hypothetical protein [Proteiniborus sp. DW1]SCG82723.1 hypothetical protein DW1_1150 [Proteiniborus sp. DW1]